jgi:outer membrane protein TolC
MRCYRARWTWYAVLCVATGCRSAPERATAPVAESRPHPAQQPVPSTLAAPATPRINPAHENQSRSPAPNVRPVSWNNAVEEASRPKENAVTLRQSPEYLPAPANVMPIDLGTALAIAGGENPQVAFAQARIQEAYNRLLTAEVLWLPSLRAGGNYNKHEGRIQDVAGKIIDTSRGSVYTGMGAFAVGAGSPAVPGLLMNFHVRDAIFQPRIAEMNLRARQQSGRAVTNDLLFQTAAAYTDLLEAMQIESVTRETQAHAARLAELTESYAKAGQGLRSDADRALTELAYRRLEVRRAQEATRVASVRLTRLLSGDQTMQLVPQEPMLTAIELVPPHLELQELVATGLSNRPELAESQYLVREAVQRLRREQYAPLIPSVLLGASYGGNGGGLGSELVNFGDRLDLDAVAYWEVRNLGFAERSYRGEARAYVRQSQSRQVQVMDQVASEVAEAYAQVTSRREQVIIAQAGLPAAVESFRHNSARIQDGQGLPIETLQSIQALDQTQRQYARSLAELNRAQFALQRALGSPASSPVDKRLPSG